MVRFTKAVPAVLLALLTGCGTTAPASQLAIHSVKAAAVQAAKSTVTPKAAVAPLKAVAPARVGAMKVSLAGLTHAQRSLMAVGDITRVVITVTGVNGFTATQNLGAAQLAGANPEATFNGVPVGAATLTVTAFDASGTQLGSGTAAATVYAGQTAQANLTIHLTGAGTGNVSVSVTFVEDANPTPAETPTPSPSSSSDAGFVQPALLDVWGRFYDYSGTQLLTGSVRILSLDPAHPYDQSTTIRADGYFYLPAVPTTGRVQITATSDRMTCYQTLTIAEPTDQGYAWVDLFLSEPI